VDVGVVGMAVFYEVELPPPVSYRVAPSEAPPASTYGSSAVDGVVNWRTATDAPPPPITARPLDRAAPPPAPPRPAPPPASAREAPRTEKLGTAHGALETSAVVLVDFKRATDAPAFIRQVEYNTRENLVAAGVIPPSEHQPQAFPIPPNGFAPNPPPYR
jgi:hypothetical protein